MRTLALFTILLCGSASAAPVPKHLFPPPAPTTFGAVKPGQEFVWCGQRYLKVEVTCAFVYHVSGSSDMHYVNINARCFGDTSVQPMFDDSCPVN
jgi:hypothetical protein